MFKSLRAHRGSMVFAIVLVLMTLAVIVLAVKAGSVITEIGQRFTGTQGTMTRIQQSLVQYVAVNGELPCPANPALVATVILLLVIQMPIKPFRPRFRPPLVSIPGVCPVEGIGPHSE